MGAQDVVFEVTVRKMYVRKLDLFDLMMLFRWLLYSMPRATPVLLFLAKHGTLDHNDLQLTASKQELSGLGSSGSASASRAPRHFAAEADGSTVLTTARFCWFCPMNPDASS